MPRRRSDAATKDEKPAVEIEVLVDPNAVLSVDTFRNKFRLSKSTVRTEVRKGRLRVCRRAGRYFLIGSAILEWLRDGEVKPRAKGAPGQSTEGAQ